MPQQHVLLSEHEKNNKKPFTYVYYLCYERVSQFVIRDPGDDCFRECGLCDCFSNPSEGRGRGRELYTILRMWGLANCHGHGRTTLFRDLGFTFGSSSGGRVQEPGRNHCLELFVCYWSSCLHVRELFSC